MKHELTKVQENMLCRICPNANRMWDLFEPSKVELKIVRSLQRKRLAHIHHGNWRTTVAGREIVLDWMIDDV